MSIARVSIGWFAEKKEHPPCVTQGRCRVNEAMISLGLTELAEQAIETSYTPWRNRAGPLHAGFEGRLVSIAKEANDVVDPAFDDTHVFIQLCRVLFIAAQELELVLPVLAQAVQHVAIFL